MPHFRFFLYWLRRTLLPALLGLAACQPAGPGTPPPAAAVPVRTRFFALLRAGDSVYAQKQGYRSFAQAQAYYDRAQALADQGADTLLLAEAVFARGRVYDAWNKEPAKTVAYFQQAAALFGRLPGQWRRYYYARFLVAHAYDKVPDSLRAVQVLRGLRAELAARPDSVRRQVPSTVEMALTATEVRNYPLADSLLRQLVHRPGVRNDPATYDYLVHYYLAQARLDVFYRRHPAAPFLDSLRQSYRTAANPLDRLYYEQNLARLSAAAGRPAAAYAFLRQATRLGDSLADGGDVAQLRRTLLQTEEQAARRQRADEAAHQALRTRSLWGLSAGLAVISLLSFYLARQVRRAQRQARRLAAMNQELGAANQELAAASRAVAGVNRQLDEKVAQVELLNKEIQHRVKNNLHMVFSLLHMQERRSDNEEVIEQLQAARLRVESIAALQTQLLRNPAVPDLTAFLKQLISAVVGCLATDRPVVTHLATEAVDLPVNSYFALSLILNEWVTNTIKYAEPPADHAIEVNVSVKPQGPDVLVEYFDNGRRVPAATPVPEAEAAGLGTQIIALLSQQLGAELTTRPGQPYHYELRIPHGA